MFILYQPKKQRDSGKKYGSAKNQLKEHLNKSTATKVEDIAFGFWLTNVLDSLFQRLNLIVVRNCTAFFDKKYSYVHLNFIYFDKLFMKTVLKRLTFAINVCSGWTPDQDIDILNGINCHCFKPLANGK